MRTPEARAFRRAGRGKSASPVRRGESGSRNSCRLLSYSTLEPQPKDATGGTTAPCSSSAMSSGRLFLDRVARQHCPSPLHRQLHPKTVPGWGTMNLQRTENSVLTVCLTKRGSRKPTLDNKDRLGPHRAYACQQLLDKVLNKVLAPAGPTCEGPYSPPISKIREWRDGRPMAVVAPARFVAREPQSCPSSVYRQCR
jgi:hypothetical protein